MAYLHGRGMDELISQTASPTTYYYQDILNNVRGLTDDKTEKIQSYSYSAFGEVEITTYKKKLGFLKREVGQPFKFNGRPLDKSTNLYYYRLRDYDPRLGRFIQPDPLGQIPSPNIYTYCNNNPVNWVDPWGLKTPATMKNAIKKAKAVEVGDSPPTGFGIEREEHDWGCDVLANFSRTIIDWATSLIDIPFKDKLLDEIEEQLEEYYKNQTLPDNQKNTENKSQTDNKECK